MGSLGKYSATKPHNSLASRISKICVVAEVILTGHNFNSRRRTERLRIAVFEPHTLLGQTIENRRLIRCAAVTAETLIADVIGHNQNDIGFSGFSGRKTRSAAAPLYCQCRRPQLKVLRKSRRFINASFILVTSFLFSLRAGLPPASASQDAERPLFGFQL